MSQVWQERSQSCKVQEHQGKWSKEIRRTESEQGQRASPNLTQERGPSVEDDAENHELEEEATATDMSALALASKWQMIDRHVVAWRRFNLDTGALVTVCPESLQGETLRVPGGRSVKHAVTVDHRPWTLH